MKTILIIEDDINLRETTAELLALSDYKPLTAPDGKVGIEMALKLLPDLIICDIMMPKINGYEVLEALALRENTRHIPFIFLSAKTEHKEIRKGMDLGADDYLTKPFEEEDLLNSIQRRLQKSEDLLLFNEKHPDPEKEPKKLESLGQLKNLFEKEGALKDFRKNEVIYRKNEHSNQLFLILEGLVKTHIIDSRGKELITGLYKPDDFLGFSSFDSRTPFTETATTIKDTRVVGIAKDKLKNILYENQGVSLEFVNLLSDNLTDIKRQLMQMAYSSVRKKTASAIIQFVELMNHKPEMAIRITRNDLAASAGIATESLIRTLSDFKKEKLIDIQGRTIKILDLDKLKNIH